MTFISNELEKCSYKRSIIRHEIETFDGREACGKDRWKTIGLVSVALLAVVYTVRSQENEVIRLISARKADAHERSQYG